MDSWGAGGFPPPTPTVAYDFSVGISDLPVFLTLILLEGALSFDNAAILAALTRRLPLEERRKALLYGLIGAYFFRVLAILLVTYIIENPWLKIAGGLYLVFLAVRHLTVRDHDPDGTPRGVRTFFGLSAFWSTVVAVEIADIAFALDQVLVAVALTDSITIIIAAALIAILLLRLSAFYMTLLMDWFPSLERFAYLAVGFVGLKMLLEELTTFEISKVVSITTTLGILVVPVLVKLLLDARARRARAR